MGNEYHLKTPLSAEDIEPLRSGDRVTISGIVYTARDAAHRRIIELIEAGKELPIPIEGQVIYYVGPSPAPPGRVIGAAGPTTSYRMDPFAPKLLELGLKGMIGKGKRSKEVVEAMVRYKGVYMAASRGRGRAHRKGNQGRARGCLRRVRSRGNKRVTGRKSAGYCG